MIASIRNALRTVVAPLFHRPTAQQVAALCYRDTTQGQEVLMITSRDTGRWILPKGWPMRDKTDAEAAAQEAWEEAGVKPAVIADTPIGSYGYDKVLDNGLAMPIETTVYAVEVDKLANKFPEAKERKRKWMRPDKAANLVDEPELRALLHAL